MSSNGSKTLLRPAQTPPTLSESGDHYERNGHDYVRVTTVLRGTGLAHDYSGIDPFYRERGQAVHKAVELYDKGTLDETHLDERIVPYLQAYKDFVRISGYEAFRCEIPLWCDRLRCAGTADKVGYLNGRLGLIDIKSTDHVDPAVKYQLCGYGYLWAKRHKDLPLGFRYALQLKGNGTFNLVTKYSQFPIEKWPMIVKDYRHGLQTT